LRDSLARIDSVTEGVDLLERTIEVLRYST
jgi:hypothetical protein